ncbi:hypothetical protein [Actinomadura sediminis]|uniref:Uncharacterized protein n=1 Tax=Actinomadura sediminis TaxID=1038904 RepID=A0ABW3F0A2_9ACTN
MRFMWHVARALARGLLDGSRRDRGGRPDPAAGRSAPAPDDRSAGTASGRTGERARDNAGGT